MKAKNILLTLSLSTVLFVGCAKTPVKTPQVTSPQTKPSVTTPNVVTTASIVDNAAAFENAISSKGTWIIAITKDLAINKDLVIEGEFKNGKKDTAGKDIIQRKIALYAQDQNKTITARYTLTAPKLTFKSPMGSIEHGTFKGDLYVSASNFKLIDATVDGNIYFTTAESKSTFKIDATSKVTGKQEMKK
ncbi:hypothetical protein [Clostridium tagluense]|uniref:Lipoprotein n=1 Tax=Clostridium tagluense TaxID=360422 RepID=A0A401USE8_9CLOT|nr:hypothetical protein [Clostridium tagluense]GCD12475.1 hypothetical protein Ctaglu_40980 [Clostridium tagluense]